MKIIYDDNNNNIKQMYVKVEQLEPFSHLYLIESTQFCPFSIRIYTS